MIKIEKSFGVKDADDVALMQLQEAIVSAKQQFGWIGKTVIDSEKITFYKFGLKLGLVRLYVANLVVDEYGRLKFTGMRPPILQDREILTDLYVLFGKKCPF